MINIPPQIRSWRFIKVMQGQKIPVESEWQKTNNYSYDDFQDYAKVGYNYGVLPTEGKVVIDIDKKSPDFEEALRVAESLPETFTVKTANGGFHFYFNCPDLKKGIRMKNEAGEVRTNGMFVVGPFSQLNGGKKYIPTKFVPVASITKEDIDRGFSKWIGEDTVETPFKKPKDLTRSGKEFGIVLRLIKKGRSKEQIFKYMAIYDKWANAHPQYREYTYTNAMKRYETSKIVGIGFNPKGRFVPKLLADAVLACSPIKTLKGSDKMYRYQDGYYTEDGKEYIKELCSEFLGELSNRNRFNEAVHYIQSTTYIDPNEVNNEWINFENGLLDPITMEFKPHTPDVFSTIRIPIIYDPEADCPLWKEKLAEKLDKKSVDLVQELFGYCYLPGQKHERAFLFYGPMRTMKSTTLFVLEKMLGDQNVSAYQLQWLTENQFGPAYIYGKSANICPDLSTQSLRDTGRFMTITGGDKISASRKGEHPISFYPTAKLVFSCNDIPPTTNKNLAFYRRWIILEFKKQHKNPDPDLKDKLLAELPGIVNWSLKGLRRLNENNSFGYWLDEEQVKDLYERGSNSIQSFIFNEIDTEDDEGVLKKREVYTAYKEYCRANDLRLENPIKFGRMFFALSGCGNCKQDKIPAYQGISWKVQEVNEQQRLGAFK